MLTTVARAGSSAKYAVVVPRRGAKQKMTPEAIRAAQEAKAAQKKSFLDQFYSKHADLIHERQRIDERDAMDAKIRREATASKRTIRRLKTQGDSLAFDAYARATVEDMRARNAHANDPSLSERARRRAFELYNADPRPLLFIFW